MINIDKYDIINIFAFASEFLSKEEFNESQIETLQKFYNNSNEEQQAELLDLFPEVVHIVG